MIIIPSPCKRWPGQIILPDYLTLPQYKAWHDAVAQLENTGATNLDIAGDARLAGIILPGVLACVERWELENFPKVVTVENFPATPRAASFKLLAAVIGRITQLVTEEDELPPA